MFNVSTFGNTADIYAIVHLVPHACHHITVDQSHSSGDTVAKIWRLAGSGNTKTVSFTNPQKKKSDGVKSCSIYPPLWQVSIEIPSHVFVVSRRAVLLKRCNHYCLHSTVASASFLTCFTDLWITLCVYIYIYIYIFKFYDNTWWNIAVRHVKFRVKVHHKHNYN